MYVYDNEKSVQRPVKYRCFNYLDTIETDLAFTEKQKILGSPTDSQSDFLKSFLIRPTEDPVVGSITNAVLTPAVHRNLDQKNVNITRLVLKTIKKIVKNCIINDKLQFSLP